MAASSAPNLDLRTCDFSPRSLSGIPGVYQIRFANKDRFLEAVFKQDPLMAGLFQRTISGEFLLRRTDEYLSGGIKGLEDRLAGFVRQSHEHQMDPKVFTETFGVLIEEQKNNREKLLSQITKKLDVDGGYDVVTTKQVVHHILGIEKQLPFGITSPASGEPLVEFSQAERGKYYQIMKDAEFLDSKAPSVVDVVYKPGDVIREILENNPHVDKLLLGCGRGAVSYDSHICNNSTAPQWGLSASGSKKDQIIAEHEDSALTIDIDSESDPHLFSDMFDLEMLKEIPSGRIKRISDHSNGFLSLNGDTPEAVVKKKEAFTEYFRILAPGGRIELIGLVSKEHGEVFEEIGFKVDCENAVLVKG